MRVTPSDGRARQDGTITISELTPGEPVFIVRGNDVTGLALINQYVALTDGYFPASKQRTLEEAQLRFKLWREGNRTLIKGPD